MTLFFLMVLKKFWLPLVIVLVGIASIYYVYNKGVNSCQERINEVIAEEQSRRAVETDKLDRRGDTIRDRVGTGVTDKQSSCILSNNPFQKDCLK